MANVTVQVFADGEFDSVTVLGGGTSSNPKELTDGDTLTVEHTSGGTGDTITVATFSSAFWTSTSSMSLSENTSATRTIKSSPSYSAFTLTCSASGFTSGTIYLETVEPPPPISASKPNAFTVDSITDVNPGDLVTFESVSVAGNTASATSRVTGGVEQSKVAGSGWTTSDITVNAGDTVYLRATASSSYSTTTSFTLRIGDLSGSNGEDYDYETSSFSVTTRSDPGVGQTINFPISSGTISMGDIIEFFHFAPVAGDFGPQPAEDLASYYRGGTYVPDVAGNSGIPTSGVISLDDFYGSETRWYVTAPNAFFRSVNTLSGPSSFTLLFVVNNDSFGGGYAPNVGKRTEFKNGSPVIVWDNNPGTLTLSGGSSTYTSNFSLTVSTTAGANQEREIYGYIPIDARNAENTSITQTGLRVYFWFFFFGP